MAPTHTDVINMCPTCGAHSYGGGSFCTGCGATLAGPHQPPPPSVTFTNNSNIPQHIAARGICQTLGLEPVAGVTTLAVNLMLFTGTVMTMGALVPVAIGAAGILGYITYKRQILFGDSHTDALTKALAVGLITAIPVGIPAVLTVPSTVCGVVQTLRRKD